MIEDLDPGQRWRYGAVQAAGLGALVGGLETLRIAWQPVPWTLADLLPIGLAAVGIDAVAGAVLGMIAGPVHTMRRSQHGYRNVATQLGIVAAVFAGAAVWARTAELWAAGDLRWWVGPAFAGLMGVIVTLNSRYLLARNELGRGLALSWRAVSLGGASMLVGAGALIGAAGSGGSGQGLSTDPHAIVITVEGLSTADAASLPTLEALRTTSSSFTAAISPSSSAVASQATVWTALHPLRHRALADDRAITASFPTVAERLGDAGYGVAAFVSSARVSGVGLERGFTVFDDHFGGLGLERLALVQALGGVGVVRRSPEATVTRALRWFVGTEGGGQVMWIQLEAAAGLPQVDAALARVLGVLETSGRVERTMVVVVGTPGRGSGLSDAVVRVPLVLRTPGKGRVPEVTAQVRLADVPMTLLAWSAVPRPDDVEGLDLLAFHDGRRQGSVWTSLVGPTEAGWLLAVRQDDVKAVFDPAAGVVSLFHLGADPEERRDQAAVQPDVAEAAQRQLDPEAAALERVAKDPVLGSRRAAVLAALGAAP